MYLFMKKTVFLFFIVILFLGNQVAFWLSPDQASQIGTSTKFLW